MSRSTDTKSQSDIKDRDPLKAAVIAFGNEHDRSEVSDTLNDTSQDSEEECSVRSKIWRVSPQVSSSGVNKTDFAVCLVDTVSSEAFFDIITYPAQQTFVPYKESPQTLLQNVLEFAIEGDQDAGRITTFLSSEDHPYLNHLRILYERNGFVKGDMQHTVIAWGETRTVDRWPKTLKSDHSGSEPEFNADEKLWQIGALRKHPALSRRRGVYE